MLVLWSVHEHQTGAHVLAQREAAKAVEMPRYVEWAMAVSRFVIRISRCLALVKKKTMTSPQIRFLPTTALPRSYNLKCVRHARTGASPSSTAFNRHHAARESAITAA
jgi:hypothetical protein